MTRMTATSISDEQLADERDAARRALTLAVVCVEQRVEALRKEWRAMTQRQQDQAPGLETQLEDERAALRWLEHRRSEAYRA